MLDKAALAALLHARIDEQRPENQELIPKYHRLVDEHADEHRCSDDDLLYDPAMVCPWLSSFATMWREDPGYLADWPREMTWGTGRMPAGPEEPEPIRMTLVHREPGTACTEAAAAALVGQSVPVTVEGRPIPVQARVLDAAATGDGTGFEVTVEIPDAPETAALKQALTPDLRSFSIGTGPRPR